MVIQCKECGTVLEQTEGKRKREFCNSTCRSNFWQKEKRKAKTIKAPNKTKKEKTTKKPSAENKTTGEAANERHRLWKEGDPKENSGAFFMKYDCMNYSELENK